MTNPLEQGDPYIEWNEENFAKDDPPIEDWDDEEQDEVVQISIEKR